MSQAVLLSNATNFETQILISPLISPGPGMRVWGSRDGPVMRALVCHQCGLGLISGLDVICGLSLLLVLVLAPRGFPPGSPVFPSPQKPTFSNSNSIWNLRATELSVVTDC